MWRRIAPHMVRLIAVSAPVVIIAGAHSRSPDIAQLCLSVAVFGLALRAAYAPRVLPRAVGTGVKSLAGAAFGTLILTVSNRFLPGTQMHPISIVLAGVGVAFLSAVGDSVVRGYAPKRERVLIVGRGNGGAALARKLRRERGEFALVGLQDVKADLHALAGIPTFPPDGSIASTVANCNPSVIVLAEDGSYEIIDELLNARALGVRVVSLSGFYEFAFAFVPIVDISSRWFMTVLHLRQPRYSAATKRIFDLGFAGVALLTLSPLLPIIGGLVWLTSPGPVFFKQRRVGEGGRIFKIVKFRTMVIDAEVSGAPIWAMANDPRVTSVGRFLRTSHLDEIPQLWNIVRGDMSVVGPRPERPEFVALLESEIPFWTRRNLMRPGLTGWAQVGNGYTANTNAAISKLSYDLWYLNHQSLVLDVAIVAITVKVGVLGLFGHTVESRVGTSDVAIPRSVGDDDGYSDSGQHSIALAD